MKQSAAHRKCAGNRVTVYEQVTRRITELLEQGVVPWQKPWSAHVGPPRNGVSGRYYRGFNIFMLSLAGYDSPWWFTPRQVNDLDGHIVKGERVSWVTFFKPWLPKEGSGDAPDTDADETEASSRRRPVFIVRSYRVVNLDQCTGPGIQRFRDKHPVDRPAQNDNDPIAGCEAIVAGMPSPPAIRHGGNRACYWPAIDQISMPKRETFVSSEAFYSTLFHELTHSTGHPDRLNRKTLVAGAPFRSPTYTREELCAEMGAAFLCATAGIQDPTIENSASYLQGWLKYLSSDPKALLVAGAQAQKAADYVLGHAGVEEVDAAEESAEAAA